MEKIPSQHANANIILGFYLLFKTLPIFISGMSIYLGYKLFILGVTGEASLSVKTDTVSGQLINAAPGLFFAVGGIISLIIVVWKGVKISFGDREFGEDGRVMREQYPEA